MRVFLCVSVCCHIHIRLCACVSVVQEPENSLQCMFFGVFFFPPATSEIVSASLLFCAAFILY